MLQLNDGRGTGAHEPASSQRMGSQPSAFRGDWKRDCREAVINRSWLLHMRRDMAPEPNGYWQRLVQRLRSRLDLSQTDFAEALGVDQSTVSRWEHGLDLPSRASRNRLKALMRSGGTNRFDTALRWRVRTARRPVTLVGPGARFLEVSPPAGLLLGLDPRSMRERAIYGLFGPEADEATEAWEHSGIFEGELAMTMAVNRVVRDRRTLFIGTEDMPHAAADGEIWCLCELRSISQTGYRAFFETRGGRLAGIPFEAIAL